MSDQEAAEKHALNRQVYKDIDFEWKDTVSDFLAGAAYAREQAAASIRAADLRFVGFGYGSDVDPRPILETLANRIWEGQSNEPMPSAEQTVSPSATEPLVVFEDDAMKPTPGDEPELRATIARVELRYVPSSDEVMLAQSCERLLDSVTALEADIKRIAATAGAILGTDPEFQNLGCIEVTLEWQQKRITALESDKAKLRTALEVIQHWDCLNPPNSNLCADHPWLKKHVDAALEETK